MQVIAHNQARWLKQMLGLIIIHYPFVKIVS